jgi:hypothetical protein
MQTAGTTQWHQRKFAGIMAAIDRDQANAVRHMRVGDTIDSEGCLRERDAERPRDRVLDHLVRELGLKRQGTSGKECWIKITKHDGGVRYGCALTTPPVTGRTWLGAGRLWPHAQTAAAVDPGNRAAAGAQGRYIEHGHAHGVAGDMGFRPHLDAALADERYVARGSADIDGDEVVEPSLGAYRRTAERTGRRARQEQAHWP